MLNIKVINAGNCMICGRKIKIVTKKRNDIFPNILFCPRCERQIAKKHAGPQESEEKPSWLGKSCKDCGNEKCKKLGTLPKGYDCALWQAESEE